MAVISLTAAERRSVQKVVTDEGVPLTTGFLQVYICL